MSPVIRKEGNTSFPTVALLSQATWVNQQLDQASWRRIGSVARKLVDALSGTELRLLPPETRQRLMRHLSSGRITAASRKAVNKLLAAELVEVEYQQRIIIKGPTDFVDKTKSHLTILARLPIGQELFNSLRQSGKSVTIIPTDRISEAPPDDFKAAVPKGKVLRWRELWGEKVMRGTGKGSNTTIKYNPTLYCTFNTADRRKSPPEIALAHELIHADDAAHGRLEPDEINGVRNYERQAVGLPPYESKYFTENKFRASWHPPLPPRNRY
jgi:hypothetical protein